LEKSGACAEMRKSQTSFPFSIPSMLVWASTNV
jgi:hypothetical protein